MNEKYVPFDNKFITKKSLKLHLNFSPFKLYTISPKNGNLFQQIITVHEKTPLSRHLERLFGTEYASENILPNILLSL